MTVNQIELPAGFTAADIREPNWKAACRVHDWRNHVPEEVRQAWVGLPYYVRFMLARWADELAGNEVWD